MSRVKFGLMIRGKGEISKVVVDGKVEMGIVIF